METALLIASILAYHYPSGLYRDTQRRLDNMRKFNKSFEYEVRNTILPFDHRPIYKFPLALTSLFAGALLPLFCLRELDFSWFYTILINLVLYFFLGPTMAFCTTPMMAIYDKHLLKSLATTFLAIGLLCYGLALYLK